MFSRLGKLTALAVTALAFAGCDIKTPDGKVPAEHVAMAQQYAGNYNGQMEGRAAGFSIQVAEDGTATMSYWDSSWGDIVGQACNSQIGQLRSIRVNDGELKRATFALSTDCNITGDHVSLWVDGNNVSVQIEEQLIIDHICRGPPESHQCETRTRPVYLEGKFSR